MKKQKSTFLVKVKKIFRCLSENGSCYVENVNRTERGNVQL